MSLVFQAAFEETISTKGSGNRLLERREPRNVVDRYTVVKKNSCERTVVGYLPQKISSLFLHCGGQLSSKGDCLS